MFALNDFVETYPGVKGFPKESDEIRGRES